MTPTPDPRAHRYVTRHPGILDAPGGLEVVLRLAGDLVAEIEALRDQADTLAQLPPSALVASIRYLAELIVGPARPPEVEPLGPESVLGPDPATVAAEALRDAERRQGAE